MADAGIKARGQHRVIERADGGRCGSTGYIAWRDGKPWSVNVDVDRTVMDWRYALPENDCPECKRLRGDERTAN